MQAYTAITSQVMCNNEDYFSVLVTTESFMGAETSQILAGHTFALQGGKAGTCISLPYLLGLLEADENDTWMQDRATAKANELVYGLVWSIIEEQKAEEIIAYYDDLTREELEAQFYPEEDFYLDENGNPCSTFSQAILPAARKACSLSPLPWKSFWMSFNCTVTTPMPRLTRAVASVFS